MPQNGYSIGKDVTLVIVTAAGPIQFDGITGFDSKQDVVDINAKPLDGGNVPLKLPDGWSGSFDYDRKSGSIDRYFAANEAAYFAGADQLNVSIVELIHEPDGSLSEFVYLNVAMHLDNAGTRRGNDKTTQRIAFKAGRREQRL